MRVGSSRKNNNAADTENLQHEHHSHCLACVEFGTLVISRDCGDLLYRMFRSDFVVCFVAAQDQHAHTREV